MCRDPRFQRGAFPISHRIIVEHVVCGGDCVSRGAGAGLAEFHVDNAAPLSFEAVSEAGHGNGLKRINLCSHDCWTSHAQLKRKARRPGWNAAPSSADC